MVTRLFLKRLQPRLLPGKQRGRAARSYAVSMTFLRVQDDGASALLADPFRLLPLPPAKVLSDRHSSRRSFECRIPVNLMRSKKVVYYGVVR